MRYTTPLRYPGGKAKVANFVKLLFEYNDLLDGEYAEPYAGGAGVAFALLFDEYASRVHINDLDPAIYAFWHAVLHESDAMCRLVRSCPLTMDEWRRQRTVLEAGDATAPLELGFAAFYMNRTNRSGIVTGGPIGGVAQTGEWKLDARFNRVGLTERIEQTARYADRVSLTNLDATVFLRRIASKLPKRSLTYLDPPYFVKGQQRLYASYYRESDHAQVAERVATLKRPWMVSYDNAPAIRDLYKEFEARSYGLAYSAADRYTGSEIMFFSPGLNVPDVEDPSSLSSRDLAQLTLQLK